MPEQRKSFVRNGRRLQNHKGSWKLSHERIWGCCQLKNIWETDWYKNKSLTFWIFWSNPAIETNLPEEIKERAVSVFKSAISQKFIVKDSIEKVQKEALSEIENVYKGKRFKVHNQTGRSTMSSPRTGILCILSLIRFNFGQVRIVS